MAQETAIKAFVLAGARASGDQLASRFDVPSKAYIQIAGRSMLGRVLDALHQSERVGGLSVIGLAEHGDLQHAETWPRFVSLPGADGPAASVAGALASNRDPFPALVTTCDHALLTPEIVDGFLYEIEGQDIDLAVALARRQDIEAAYPDVKRTYLSFGDGAYSSCNLFCLKTPEAARVVTFWKTAEEDRKRPWRLAWRFGVVSAIRLLVGRPPIEKAFRILSGSLGVRVHPVILPFADAAVDVDTPDDLALVERVLSRRPQ
ncbi:MAG: nucleotidyltransferase family protein [Pseudomonadota bacterium]